MEQNFDKGFISELEEIVRTQEEKEKTEEEFRKSSIKYSTLFENANDAIFIADTKTGLLLDTNKEAENLIGRPREEIIGMDQSELHPPDKVKYYKQKFVRHFLSGRKADFEAEVIKKDGTIVPVYISAAVMELEGKKVIQGIFRDITDRKKAEIALKEMNKNLEEMVYLTSHDLQTPLISMEGYASELLDNYKDMLDDDGIYCLSRLKSNAQRMHNLVLNLLDISKLNTEKYPYESFDTNILINNITRDLSLTIEKANVNVEIREMPPIYGDKRRFDGVFRKLITNAILYGGNNIIIGYKYDTYFVKDDGIGIPENQLEKIFTPGERLKMVEIDGAGMGLTFCRRVIYQNGGEIWAESEGTDKGSTFYIKLIS